MNGWMNEWMNEWMDEWMNIHNALLGKPYLKSYSKIVCLTICVINIKWRFVLRVGFRSYDLRRSKILWNHK